MFDWVLNMPQLRKCYRDLSVVLTHHTVFVFLMLTLVNAGRVNDFLGDCQMKMKIKNFGASIPLGKYLFEVYNKNT